MSILRHRPGPEAVLLPERIEVNIPDRFLKGLLVAVVIADHLRINAGRRIKAWRPGHCGHLLNFNDTRPSATPTWQGAWFVRLQMVVAEASGLTGIGVVTGLALAAATPYSMIGSFSLLIAPFVAWWRVAAICVSAPRPGLHPARHDVRRADQAHAPRHARAHGSDHGVGLRGVERRLRRALKT
jgi:hypothetical protein